MAPASSTTLDLAVAGVDAGSFVVVATQGHYDEEALERALRTPAPYVGLVASRRRAEAVLGTCATEGSTTTPSRVFTRPQGWTSATSETEEIAVTIVAEIVQLRAAGELDTGRISEVPTRHNKDEPVYGITMDVANTRFRTVPRPTFYFCSAGCLESFRPVARFIDAAAP